MSEIRVDSITDEVGTSSPDFPNGILKSSLPAGNVLQVLSATQDERVIVSGSGGATFVTFNDITGLSLNITPTSVNSKILLMAYVVVSGLEGSEAMLRFYKNGTTPVGVGANTGSRTPATAITTIDWEDAAADFNYGNVMAISHTMMHLDSPNTTNSVSYTVQTGGRNATQINRFLNDIDNFEWGSSISSFTIMEIAG